MVFINCWKPLECGVCDCVDVRTTVCILLKGVFFHVSISLSQRQFLILGVFFLVFVAVDTFETCELIFLILAHAIVNFQWTTINTLITDIFYAWFEYICERSIESDILDRQCLCFWNVQQVSIGLRLKISFKRYTAILTLASKLALTLTLGVSGATETRR